MKRFLVLTTLPICLILLIPNFMSGGDDIPNQFEFISATYFASGGCTNAAITVRFLPGTRAYSGSVDYTTHDGTAVANQDYTPTAGTLNYSGNSYRTFVVPLKTNSQGLAKSVQLILRPSVNDANALITRSNAVLNINLPPPPSLRIAPAPGGWVNVSWTDDGTNPLLERRTASETTWTPTFGFSSDGQGTMTYTEPCTGMTYFRLRREQ